jgi:hypothetical protein
MLVRGFCVGTAAVRELGGEIRNDSEALGEEFSAMVIDGLAWGTVSRQRARVRTEARGGGGRMFSRLGRVKGCAPHR